MANIEGLVRVRIYVILYEMLLKIYHDFFLKVIIDWGKNVIYMVLMSELYGDLFRSLFLWRDLVGKLKSWGFQMKFYDPCVTNKFLREIICTVCWHIDDLKILQVQSAFIDDIVRCLEDQYCRVTVLMTIWGTVHNYLGMLLGFRKMVRLRVIITKQIQIILEDAPMDMYLDGFIYTPAANHIFHVMEDHAEL